MADLKSSDSPASPWGGQRTSRDGSGPFTWDRQLEATVAQLNMWVSFFPGPRQLRSQTEPLSSFARAISSTSQPHHTTVGSWAMNPTFLCIFSELSSMRNDFGILRAANREGCS